MTAPKPTANAPEVVLPPLDVTRDEYFTAFEESPCDVPNWQIAWEKQREQVLCRERQLLAALTRAAEAERERDEARRYLIDAGRNAGCYLEDTVSTKFLGGIPDEVAAAIKRGGAAEDAATIARLKEALTKIRDMFDEDEESIGLLAQGAHDIARAAIYFGAPPTPRAEEPCK